MAMELLVIGCNDCPMCHIELGEEDTISCFCAAMSEEIEDSGEFGHRPHWCPLPCSIELDSKAIEEGETYGIEEPEVPEDWT